LALAVPLRGQRYESGVAQLFTLGGRAFMKFTLGDASSNLKVLSVASYAVGIYTIVCGAFFLLWTLGLTFLGILSGNLEIHFNWASFLSSREFLIPVLYLVSGTALFYAGRYMARRVHFWRVVICSILGLFVLPFGLAVGGITLSVMTRKTVREIFAA
jgi:hypothetical protein